MLNKMLMKRTGERKSHAGPPSLFLSDEVIKHQPALYINDVKARDF